MEEESSCKDDRDWTKYDCKKEKRKEETAERQASRKLLENHLPTAELVADEEDDWEDYIPKPPDGGWGWVIIVASFFNNFILDGIAYCFGVFLTEYATYFDTSIGNTSLSNSLLCGVYLTIGPIVGALVNKFGCRPVGIAGSIIGACAFILSTFSPSILVFQLAYGIFGGFGFGMMYLPAVVGVGFYFEKKRALATGIAVCGTGIGTFTLAPFAKFLLFHLDWKNTHYVFAGLLLQGCIFSSLMRPLTGRRRKPQKIKKEAPPPIGSGRFTPLPTIKDIAEPSNADTISRTVTQSSRMIHVSGKSHHPPRLHASAYMHTPTRTTEEIIENMQRPMYKKDIFYSGSLYNIPSYKQQHTDGSEPYISVPSIPDTEVHYHRMSCLNRLPKPIADILAEMLDIHVLQNKAMLTLLAANLFGMLGFYVPIIFSTDRAERYGVPETDAAFLLSIMGICNTIGRLLSGCVAFVPRISPLLFNNVCITLAAMSVILTPFCTTFTSMALIIASYGLFSAAFISLASVIVCDLVGLEKLTNGFGLICLVRGIAAIIGPPLEGMLYDFTGDYDATFYMGGTCLLISAALHILLQVTYMKETPSPAAAN